jgi:hypothetical protein
MEKYHKHLAKDKFRLASVEAKIIYLTEEVLKLCNIQNLSLQDWIIEEVLGGEVKANN